MRAFQDNYPDELSHCYGCGRNNPHGHQLKSYWDGDRTVARFLPEPCHTAIPGFVYGGLIASLIDCHGTGSAAAAMYRAQGREMDNEPPLRCVTAAIKVDFLAPTPMGVELVIRGEIEELTQSKAIISVQVFALDTLCVRGRVVAVKMPEVMRPS